MWLGFLSGALATVWNAPSKGVKFARSMRDAEQAQQELGKTVVWSSVISSSTWQEQTEPPPKDWTAYGASLNFTYVEGFQPNLIDPENVEPLPDDGWHLVNWTWYSISFLVGVAGVVAIRVGASEATQKTEETQSSLAEIKESLNRLVLNLGQLVKDSKTMAPSKILAKIDDELAEDFRTFAEGRESMTVEYGLSVFADVMTHFASGERAVNRAWSASADGYVNEAEACLERGLEMLQQAYQILDSQKA